MIRYQCNREDNEKITDPHLWVQRIRKIMNYNVLSLLAGMSKRPYAGRPRHPLAAAVHPLVIYLSQANSTAPGHAGRSLPQLAQTMPLQRQEDGDGGLPPRN